MKLTNSKDIYLAIGSLCILFYYFYTSIETLTYIFDGGHHGSIFSNSLDLIAGKTPYIEIFLQYGFLNTFVNSFFVILFDQNILGIYFSTTFFYTSSIILIALISKKFNNIYAFSFTILFCIFNHPVPEYPWPNYTAFFFLVLSIFLFDLKPSKLFCCGFLLSLSCLTRENFYYFIIPSIIFISLLIYFLTKEKKNIFYLIFGFFIPLSIFFLYLLNNNIFQSWLEYQKLPFVYLESYGASFTELLIKFIKFFIFEVPFKLGTDPQYFLILIIIFFNIYILIEELFFKKNHNIKVIFICLLSLSSIVVSINYEIFRLYTSIIIGLPIIFYKLDQLNKSNFKFVILFVIFFISIFSVYYYPKGNVKFFSKINYEKSFTSNDIKYFKSQKWEEDKWLLVKTIKSIDELVHDKCNIKYMLNLTPNAFILPLSKFERIQLVPVFNEHLGREFPLKFQKNFKNLVNEEIVNNNIYIYSMENNINILENKLLNYNISHRIKVSGYKGTEIRVFMPKNCYDKIKY